MALHLVSTREELGFWLTDRPSGRNQVVMLLKGDSKVVNEFKDEALRSASTFPHREVVWVKDPGLFTTEEITSFFKDDQDVIAVVFSMRHEPKAWVFSDEADLVAADDAFLEAELAS